MHQHDPTSTQHDPREVLTERQAAQLLGVSLPTLRRYRLAGNPLVAYFRPTPRRVCVRREDVEAAIKRLRVPDAVEGAVAVAVADVAAASDAS